jgi:hypothetical protein
VRPKVRAVTAIRLGLLASEQLRQLGAPTLRSSAIKTILVLTLQSDRPVLNCSVEGTVQYSHLADDDLWRAVTKNTNAMSVLFDQQHEAGIRGLPDSSAISSISRAIDRLEREYQDYASELRRRCSLILNSETSCSVGSDRAA